MESRSLPAPDTAAGRNACLEEEEEEEGLGTTSGYFHPRAGKGRKRRKPPLFRDSKKKRAGAAGHSAPSKGCVFLLPHKGPVLVCWLPVGIQPCHSANSAHHNYFPLLQRGRGEAEIKRKQVLVQRMHEITLH